MVDPRACIACGAALQDGDMFCTECGTSVATATATGPTCPQCGTPAAGDQAFCVQCGHRLDEGSGVPAPPSPVETAPMAPTFPAPPLPEAPPPAGPRRERKRGALVGVVAAAVVVVLLAATGVGYLLVRDDGTDQPKASASTPANEASGTPTTPEQRPDGEAVEQVRRARTSIVMVGCPKGAAAEAVAVPGNLVLVRSADVAGAARVIVLGTGEPEVAEVMGVNDEKGIAVLRVSAPAAKGDGDIAAADPKAGDQVVVLGDSRDSDTEATVRVGEDGLRLEADQRPAAGRVVVGSGGVAGLTTDDGRFVPASVLTETVGEFADGEPVTPAGCASPRGPSDSTGLVASRPKVSGDAGAAVDRVVAYYTAINAHDFAKANGMRLVQGGYREFAAGFRSTYDVGMKLTQPKVKGTRASMRLSFTSTQNVEHAPKGTSDTCTRWTMTQGLEKRGSTWKIAATSKPTFTAC
ncbi:MAG: zinc-ribbon domain-containing protein [Streptosporangiales bacterium]|nr:zinc-ribbon domain-containing protein [Streptosporangiales bacterium]